VEAQGGTIEIEKPAAGRGTAVVLKLPAAEGDVDVGQPATAVALAR
jgi:hypothetical protein